MDYSHIELTTSGPVATLTLARPEVLNAVSPAMIAEIRDALGQVSADNGLKALVVRGKGRAFCAGADLVAMQESFADNASLRRYLTSFNEALFALEELPIPTVAVVHGHALAGGLELLLACDLVIAAEDARIGDQHINFGLMPGGGSTQRPATEDWQTAGDGVAVHGTVDDRAGGGGRWVGDARGAGRTAGR